MKKIGLIVMSFLMMIVCIGSTKAADIVDDGVMAYFELTNQADIEACTRTENPSCANGWSKLKTSDNQVVYCRDIDKIWPSDSDGVQYADEIDPMDAGLIYILENGYPNKTIVDGGDKDRYITQGAIWLYVTGSNNFTNNFGDPENLLPKMQELVSAARSSDVSEKINSGVISGISVDSNKMTLNNEGNYYVSSVITPQITGASKYSVSLSNGEVLSTSGSLVNSELNVGDGFIVRVPSSAGTNNNVKVSISVKTKAHMISPVGNSGYQRVIGLSTNDKTISKDLVLTTTNSEVCVDYVIVGNVKPDPSLTDPTPEKKCYDKGTKYNQENELTTRTDCKFNGWYTKDILTGKWVDGTSLNNDMTLYGAWDCPTVVDVPKTAANTPLIILGVGLVSIMAGFGYYMSTEKKNN